MNYVNIKYAKLARNEKQKSVIREQRRGKVSGVQSACVSNGESENGERERAMYTWKDKEGERVREAEKDREEIRGK